MNHSKNPLKIDKKHRGEIASAFGMVTQLGLGMAVCVILGVLLGAFLDRVLSTSPWLVIIFSIIGVGAAFKYLYDMSIKYFDNK